MRGAQAAAAALIGGLCVAAVLLLSGFRGDTNRKSDGNYINDIRVTTGGVYRFASSTQGHTASVNASRKVDFLDVYNGTAAEATLTLFCTAAPGAADSVQVYIPALASRSWPGAVIDSIRVTATFGGAAVILGGMD